MKNLKNLVCLFLTLALLFSCEVNDSEAPDDTNANATTLRAKLTSFAMSTVSTDQAGNLFASQQSSSNSNNDVECFELNYPFYVTDGQTETLINSESEFEAYLSNLNSSFQFVFPLTVTLADGTAQTVNSEQEIEELIFNCIDLSPECFDFNYPIDLVDTSGNTVTVNSDLELLTAENIEDFVYPFTVTTETGVVTINSSADFDTIYNECYDIPNCGDDCYEPCFEFIYPLTLLEDNGNIVTINSDDELYNYLSTVSPDTTFEVTFPMNVRLSDGTEREIANEDELLDLIDSCF